MTEFQLMIENEIQTKDVEGVVREISDSDVAQDVEIISWK